MLKNKKAGIGMPLVAIYSMFILFFVIIFFLAYFFVLGGAKASQITIISEELPRIQKIPNILATNLTELDPNEDPTKTLYDLIIESETQKSEKAKQRFHNAAILILNKMKNPTTKGITAYWNLIAYDPATGTAIDGLIVPKKPALEIKPLGSSQSIYQYISSDSELLNEFLLIPIPEKEPILLRLYLSCNSCTPEYLGGYA